MLYRKQLKRMHVLYNFCYDFISVNYYYHASQDPAFLFSFGGFLCIIISVYYHHSSASFRSLSIFLETFILFHASIINMYTKSCELRGIWTNGLITSTNHDDDSKEETVMIMTIVLLPHEVKLPLSMALMPLAAT